MSNSIHFSPKPRDGLEEGSEAKAHFSLELVPCPKRELERRKGKPRLLVGCSTHMGVLSLLFLSELEENLDI